MKHAALWGKSTRREFLSMSLCGIATAGLACGDFGVDPFADCALSLRPSDDPFRHDRSAIPDTRLDLLVLLKNYFQHADMDDVRAVGNVYRRTLDSDHALLVEITITVRQLANFTAYPEALESLENSVERDFNDLHVHNTGGWILAQTELHLCGIALWLA